MLQELEAAEGVPVTDLPIRDAGPSPVPRAACVTGGQRTDPGDNPAVAPPAMDLGRRPAAAVGSRGGDDLGDERLVTGVRQSRADRHPNQLPHPTRCPDRADLGAVSCLTFPTRGPVVPTRRRDADASQVRRLHRHDQGRTGFRSEESPCRLRRRQRRRVQRRRWHSRLRPSSRSSTRTWTRPNSIPARTPSLPTPSAGTVTSSWSTTSDLQVVRTARRRRDQPVDKCDEGGGLRSERRAESAGRRSDHDPVGPAAVPDARALRRGGTGRHQPRPALQRPRRLDALHASRDERHRRWGRGRGQLRRSAAGSVSGPASTAVSSPVRKAARSARRSKSYGMYLGGSSGSLFDLQGVNDERWDDESIHDDFKLMTPDQFEVVDTTNRSCSGAAEVFAVGGVAITPSPNALSTSTAWHCPWVRLWRARGGGVDQDALTTRGRCLQ